MPDYFNPPAPSYPRPHYSPVIDPFFAGLVYDLFDAETTTRSCDVPMGFGVACVQDPSNFNKVALPSAANPNFAGVIRHEHMDSALNNGMIGFPPLYPLPVLRKGHIVVKLDTTITAVGPNDPVCVRVAESGENRPGQFSNAVIPGESILWPGAKWVRGVSVGCAVVGIDLV